MIKKNHKNRNFRQSATIPVILFTLKKNPFSDKSRSKNK